jgi:acyl dehydratase
MTTRKLARPGGLFYEEFAIDDKVEGVGRMITGTDIVNFAALSGDWNLIHTDAECSRQMDLDQLMATVAS